MRQVLHLLLAARYPGTAEGTGRLGAPKAQQWCAHPPPAAAAVLPRGGPRPAARA